MTSVVVATRSPHKLAEIREIVPPIAGLRLIDLDQAGIPAHEREETIETYDSFAGNALAKARYFRDLSGLPVLADDSGLRVDALAGAPGVHTKRLSGRSDLLGGELDLANNERLLELLEGVPEPERSAHYVCVIAVALPTGDELLFEGRVDGIILPRPRGTGGFGYDPLFYVPELDRTFAEVSATLKHRISHRARALRAAVPELRRLAANHSPTGAHDPSAG